ncbi:hypothetical protein CC2G_001705 [Coprinopsis cinerea AmutBmut pab1-1]|nr:hypothetical protein CC2G_001705 [Coprinopsis cinerea AmutBmut pab1-1]
MIALPGLKIMSRGIIPTAQRVSALNREADGKWNVLRNVAKVDYRIFTEEDGRQAEMGAATCVRGFLDVLL